MMSSIGMVFMLIHTLTLLRYKQLSKQVLEAGDERATATLLQLHRSIERRIDELENFYIDNDIGILSYQFAE